MSRETDTSSSGQGRGGAAYPSGTPPYGTGRVQEGTGAAGASAEPDEPKTETTLTTRIRINIPGSRPIPPVVVRKPVSETDKAANGSGEDGPGAEAQEQRLERPAERTAETPRPQVDEPGPGAQDTARTSDWFAPRKPPQGQQPPQAAPEPSAPRPQAPGRAPQGQGPGMPYFSDAPDARDGFEGPPQQPSGPTTGPAYGTSPVPPVDDPYPTDDTAVLTPRSAGARPGPPPQVSGDTLTSGLPVVPPEHRDPFASTGSSPFPMSGPAQVAPERGGAYDPYPPVLDEPAPAAPTPPPAPEPRPAAPARSQKPQKKGRSKSVLLGAGVIGLVGVAYGAGLLLNQSDVPKGTTVLGVDIGGGTTEEAAQKLDAALGKRATAPLQVSVGGKTQSLPPAKAGLALDSQATVRGAAGSDYNPVSVIGSLFGVEREAQPVIPVDEEKLSVALADLGGGSGSSSEGTIRFEPGKAVPVPGKAGTVVDVGRSMISVRDAYRAQVETGRSNVVELPVVTREPTITQTEINRAMKEFAEPAMSGLVTIKAGGKEIQFGPQRSLPKILSMKAIDGRLVEVYNKDAIDELLDGVFDGVMITKGDGKKHQLSADDVAHAMQKALLGKTPQERTVTIELDPKG